MIAQRFGLMKYVPVFHPFGVASRSKSVPDGFVTKDFAKERNNSVYFRLSKILCGFKDQVRARPSGEKCGPKRVSERVLSAGAVLFLNLSALPSAAYSGEQYVQPEDQSIAQGREIWMSNCETCHGYGIADAPIPMKPEEWRFRLAKGKQVLYEHAINGFIGPDYSMMPARGGNDDLSDEEVRLAVDYMTFLASHYIKKPDINQEVNYDATTD